MSTANRINKALAARGLTATKLAAHLGTSNQNVYEITGGRRPGTSRLPEIAEFLGVSVEYLTTGTNAPEWDQPQPGPVDMANGEPLEAIDRATAVIAAQLKLIAIARDSIASQFGLPATRIAEQDPTGLDIRARALTSGSIQDAMGGEELARDSG